MTRFRIPFLRRSMKETRGQSMVAVVISLAGVMALCATGLETGHIYYAYRLLVSSTNAATLAGAQTMATSALDASSLSAFNLSVDSVVSKYSSVTGGYNVNSMLQNAAITTTNAFCSSTMQAAPNNVVCEQVPGGASSGYNALTVTQTAQVPLWFGGLVGMPRVNMSATATAASRGGFNIPYNLAIIMDTTASMQDTVKGDTNCTTSQITCAVQGFATMLENMAPCAADTTCTASTPYVDGVALFVFPAVSTADSANSYKKEYCSSGGLLGGLLGGGGATTVPYNFINVTPGTSQNLSMQTTGTNAGAYEIIPFNDLYKTNDSSNQLSSSSALAQAVGYSGSGCSGLSAPGGQGTYYAQVIYAAQAALLQAQQDLETEEGSSYTGSKNVMIILTDGDATASASSGQLVADNACSSKTPGSCLNGTGTSSSNPAGTSNGVCYGYNCPAYPSALGMCGQAVQAAQAATAAGTIVYTIGFGSETSGCASDQTYTTTSGSSNGAEGWPGGPQPGTPCNAIAAMASNENTFYSDNSAGCPALVSTNSGNSISVDFQQIVAGLTSPRLIPNGTP